MSQPAPLDRFCDLVMKGGITSGIVYPRAIKALAERYHFKNIGGTSAGAIAAVATAAAEYRRRTTGSFAGYEELEHLPEELGRCDAAGNTRLVRLFQPDPSCARLFRILLSILNRTSARAAAWHALLSLFGAYAWAIGFGLLLVVGLVAWLGSSAPVWFGACALALLLVVFALGASVYFDLTHALVENNYGLCSGMTQRDYADPALTVWLHELIQRLAGRGPGDPPLSFAELWAAPGGPVLDEQLPPERRRSIDLCMFTTNLHHGRPYLMPQDRMLERLFFRKQDLERVLPHEVLDWMFANGKPYAPAPRSQAEPAADAPQLAPFRDTLRELTPENFPILLAARLSLSFPILLSAVPLWVMDFDSLPDERSFRACLFSDGGLCANFPIHLFDALLPTWPTFGIQLEPMQPEWSHWPERRVFLPNVYGQGYGERWNRFDRAPDSPAKLFGFLGALLGAMQNWNDNSLARMPGVRDRVVRVRLNDDEGGLNLNMQPELIASVAQLGADAARAIREHFVEPGARGWDEQRLVRLGVLVRVLESKAAGVRRALGTVPHATPYPRLLASQLRGRPPGFDGPIDAVELEAIEEIVAALSHLAEGLQLRAASYPFQAIPPAALRVRPTI
ncbi:MAG TPA: patatin-like phospholipase family protein [Polyangiales bacterium]|nr:patatin-like phospholipase family protein [Polyangiales bacterium]